MESKTPSTDSLIPISGAARGCRGEWETETLPRPQQGGTRAVAWEEKPQVAVGTRHTKAPSIGDRLAGKSPMPARCSVQSKTKNKKRFEFSLNRKSLLLMASMLDG